MQKQVALSEFQPSHSSVWRRKRMGKESRGEMRQKKAIAQSRATVATSTQGSRLRFLGAEVSASHLFVLAGKTTREIQIREYPSCSK